MSEEVINDTVDFFSYPYEAEMKPLIDTFTNPSGKVPQTFTFDGHDYVTYFLNLNQMNSTNRDLLFDFIKAMQGNANNFLLKDEYGFGYQVARNTIGTGDGAEDEFQMKEVATVGSQTTNYDRWDIIASSYSVWVDGNLQTEGGGNDYTVDRTSSGIITFEAGSIPANLKVVEASFSYYRRVRFQGSWKNILRAYDSNNMKIVMVEENASA